MTYGVRSPERYEAADLAIGRVADALDGAAAVLLALPGAGLPALLDEHPRAPSTTSSPRDVPRGLS